MEWSLTQNKLLAFHRLMRTDKPIGALLLLWPTLWALWVATPGYSAAVDSGRFCRRRVADARRWLRGQRLCRP
ncbi:4-hydroxybenzoate octaprenyltransferase [Raoultella terrigena]|uniref:4-hydroxybenzoate octaprenyltransferase n=1 Tax=Raoultella terrigena TaxID=577 RepID=A0A3P8KSA1_RAOTE|nr:4-hydroxybenzoate octaprenyltransferase [Raoultella terrigena]